MAGRSLPHAVLMMIPEPWAGNPAMDPAVRAFYEYHSSLMEPWDGPASITFTDGTLIGAVLDRNGLRPSRYCVTTDDRVILASEAGVLDVPPDQIVLQGSAAARQDAAHRHRRRAASSATRSSSAGWRPRALRRMAGHAPGRHRGSAQRPRRAARSPDGAAAAAGVRLHPRGPAAAAHADGADRRGADRLDGLGHRAGGAVGSAAAALRLLRAAVRPGHQPAARCDPRGAGHLDGARPSGPRATCSRRRPRPAGRSEIEYPILHNDQVAKLRHLPPGSPFRSTTLPLHYNPDEDGPGLERAMDALCRKAIAGGARPATAS